MYVTFGAISIGQIRSEAPTAAMADFQYHPPSQVESDSAKDLAEAIKRIDGMMSLPTSTVPSELTSDSHQWIHCIIGRCHLKAKTSRN